MTEIYQQFRNQLIAERTKLINEFRDIEEVKSKILLETMNEMSKDIGLRFSKLEFTLDIHSESIDVRIISHRYTSSVIKTTKDFISFVSFDSTNVGDRWRIEPIKDDDLEAKLEYMDIIAFAKSLMVDQDKQKHFCQKVHSVAHMNTAIDQRVKMIDLLIAGTNDAQEIDQINEVFANGRLKVDNSQSVNRFGREGYISSANEITIMKNPNKDTYTAVLLLDGSEVSRSKRARKADAAYAIGQLLGIDSRRSFGY